MHIDARVSLQAEEAHAHSQSNEWVCAGAKVSVGHQVWTLGCRCARLLCLAGVQRFIELQQMHASWPLPVTA